MVMLSSDEPWAIASTLIFSRATAAKVRAAIPGVPRMPSPTTATSATSRSTEMRSMKRSRISCANACSRARTACCASRSGITKQMLASLDDWLIMVTECPAWANVANVRAATPGTPIMPLPSTASSAWRSIAVSALTG